MRALSDPVPISRIFLDLNNPRHKPFQTEDQAIEHLCSKEDVLPLARDIANIGMNPLELVALIKIRGKSNSYTMAEGNRRLCALKLIADPDRAPPKYRSGFEKLSQNFSPPKSLSAVVFENEEEVRPWLERIHSGIQDGRGRKDWNADQRQRFSGSRKNKLAETFLDYAVFEGFLTEADRRGKLTTVQRFLGNDVLSEAMGLDRSNPDELSRTRPKAEFDLIARRFVRDLLEGEKVTSRKNKPEIIEYARPLGSLAGVTPTRIEPESLSKQKAGLIPAPRKGSAPAPRKLEKAKRIDHSANIASALNVLGNHKLESLYNSICALDLEFHSPLVCIGMWAFMETLTACAGRTGNSFENFLHKKRIQDFGLAESEKAIRSALQRTQDYGNATKHEPVAAMFNGDQLNNDLAVLEPVILACIKEVAP